MFTMKIWLTVIVLSLLSINMASAAVPSVPASISVPSVATENTSYTVSWGASSGTVTRYELVGELTNLGSGGTSFRSIVRNKPAGSYCYKVRACNNSGCSAYVAKQCVNVLARTQTPSISPGSGTFTGSTRVSLSAESGATIRYTLNNTQVTGSSTAYSGAFNINATTTVRARAFKSGLANSIENRAVLTVHPMPVVERFEWSPSTLAVGGSTTFYWNVRNVQGCYPTSGHQPEVMRSPSGVSGPWTYTEAGSHTTQWYCIDLAGNRFPTSTSQFLSATRTVTLPNYLVSATAGSGGSISPSSRTVVQGSTTSFNVTPESGFKISSVTGCDGVLSGSTYTTGAVTANCSVDISFVKIPKVVKFEWTPNVVNVGESTTFHWSIENVASCTAVTAGVGSDPNRAASGTSGPWTYTEPREHTTQWYCTDLTGKRFPENTSEFITATQTVKAIPQPIVNRFEWLPAEVEVGNPTTFYWDIENVTECTATTAGVGSPAERTPTGESGPWSYAEPEQHTTKWYCTDLDGKRFPADENTYLEATRTVVESTLPEASVDTPTAPSAQPEVANSTVIGGTSGAFRVDESGAATYSLPIKLPSGIAGNTPELSLNYHSSAGNGPLGIGWSIGGLSGIERCRQTPVQDGAFKAITLTNTDRFCLDGQRLIVVSGNYGEPDSVYATEIDSQVKVTAFGELHGGPEYFEVRRADGSVSYYGNSDDSRFTAASGPIISWAINEVTDLLNKAGNKISYDYQLMGNEQLLSSVSYSGNTVSFQYDTLTQPDRPQALVFDKVITPIAQLGSVTVKNHSSQQVYKASLDYEQAPLSGTQRIYQITECGTNDSNCLKPLVLDWHDAAEDTPAFKTSSTTSSALTKEEGIYLSQPADINGDGLPDWVYAYKKQNTYYVRYKQSAVTGFGTDKLYKSIVSFADEAPQFRFVDVNADGKADLLYYTDKWFLCTEPQATTCNDIGVTTKDLALHDFDGNGLVDILTADLKLLTNTKTGFSQPEVVEFDTGLSGECGSEAIGHFICVKNTKQIERSIAYDINGDGLNDLVVEMLDRHSIDNQHQSYAYWGIFIAERTADGKLRFTLAEEDIGGKRDGINTAKNLQIGDLNGDGISDFLYYSVHGANQHWRIEYNSQNTLKQQHSVLDSSVPEPENARFMQLVDITGNGVSDIVYYDNGWRMLSYPYTQTPVAIDGPTIDVSGESVMFADMRGWAQPTMVITDYEQARVYWHDYGVSVAGEPCKPDCMPPCNPNEGPCNAIQSVTPQMYSTTSSFQVLDGREGKIKRFVSGHDLATEIDYVYMTNGTVYRQGLTVSSPASAPIFELTGGIPLVSHVMSDTGQGAVSVAYQYEAGRIQAGGRGMLGFEKLITTDLQTGIKTTTKYSQQYPYIGMPLYTRQEYNGKTISLSKNMYDKHVLNNGKTVFPYLKRSAESNYVVPYTNSVYGNPEYVSEVGTENSYLVLNDSYAVLQQSIVATYDFGAGKVRKVSTNNNFNHENVDNWLINRVSSTTVTHEQGAGSVSTEDICVTCTEPGGPFNVTVAMTPDTDASVSRSAEFSYFANGLLEYEITEPQGDQHSYVKTSYTYDDFGNVETSTVSSKAGADSKFEFLRSSTNVYDDASRYITAKQVNNVEVASYSNFTALGQPQTVTENGIRSILRYNAFGQPVFSREQTPGGTVSGRYSIITRGYTPAAVGLPSVGVAGYSYERVQQGGAPTQWKVADAAGRELASIVEGFGSASYVVKRTEYDAQGRPVRVSQPAYSGDTVHWHSTTLDVFGRPVQLVAADDTTTNISYSKLSVTSTLSNFWQGAAVQSKTETKDAFGQQASVTDAAGTIYFRYDATGNLLETEGVDNKKIVMTYNSRGHKQSMQDPDSGNWSYKYNALGELVEQTNPKNHVTTTWYDAFGRKTQETITHGTATLQDTQWGYSDEAGHSVRNLVVAESVAGGANRLMDYDNFGRLERSELHIDGEVLVERTTYDQYSRVFQVFDASGNDFGMQYEYQNGYVKAKWEARYGTENEHSLRYQSIEAIDALGNVKESLAGNNRTTWRTHNAASGMLESITTDNGLQAWDYSFDGIGNLRSRTDTTHKLPSLTGGAPEAFAETFDYDSLNRVETVYNSGVVTQSLSYFANGNIKTKSDVQSGASYQYGTKPSKCSRNSGPRAVSQIGTTNYCYDAMGQQTQQYNNGTKVREIDYHAIGKPSRIRSYSTDTNTNTSPGDSFFTYDGSRNLVKRHVTEQGSTKTIFQHGGVELIKELQNDGSSSTTIRRNLGNALVEVSGSSVTTRYVYTDHLGSVDVITDDKGLIEQKLSFDAFGKRRMVFTPSHQPVALTMAAILNLTHRGFTGHLQVDHASIIHMGGRIYDAHIARFLQADPFIQAPTNSQSHNRYSYVLNNPLSYTDPSGYFFKALKKYWRVIVAAVVSYYTFGLASTWAAGWAGAGFISGAIGGAAAGFVGGAITSGSLKGALQGAFSGALFGGIGGALGNSHTAVQVGAHALAGGVISTMQGGKFGHGFFSAGFTKWAGKAWSLETSKDVIGNSLKQAIIGGTASKITGGKFANGAFTAALQYIVNEAARHSFTSGKTPQQYLDENLESGEITAGLRIKRSGVTYNSSSGRLGVDAGLVSFDGESVSYNGSTGALSGGISHNLETGEMEASLNVGKTFKGVAGVEAGGFVNSNGNVGVQASATMRYYTAFVSYTMPITMPFRNAYHSFIATTEALYNDANRGIGK